MTPQEVHQYILDLRKVRIPCKDCSGMGRKLYGSTATFWGGIGGQMLTSDTCNKCWGTGDETRKGANIKLLSKMLTKEEFQKVMGK